MTKHPERPTDEELKAKALDRWNNEGGAAAPDKHPKRPRDPAQLAKLIVDIASGEVEDPRAKPTVKRAQKAGLKGGAARAAVLTPEQRSKIARAAADARWKKG